MNGMSLLALIQCSHSILSNFKFSSVEIYQYLQGARNVRLSCVANEKIEKLFVLRFL